MTPTLSLRNPVDLLAAVPYLLGFHPSDSVVLLGLQEQRVTFQARADLSTPAGPLAAQLAELLARQGLRQVLLVGYGSAGPVGAVVDALLTELGRVGIEVPEALRATAGRYWSYTCRVPECCPPDGNPYAADTSTVAAEATVAGLVALPSREALRRQLAPVEGAARASMRRATERADRRSRQIVASALAEAAPAESGLDWSTAAVDRLESGMRALEQGEAAVRAARRRFTTAGRSALREALDVYRAGRTLSDDAAAWLSVLLLHLPVRDLAWEAITGDLRPHLALWTDLTRRAQRELRAAPAALLAFTAWRAGEGATSTIALEVALDADPEHPMARLLGRAISAGVDPHSWPRLSPPRLRQIRRRLP